MTGDGTLAYLASLEVGTSRTELVWIDRSGHETDAATLPGAVSAVNLAADDRHAVVVGRDRGGVRYQLVDLDRGTTTLVASTPGASQMSAAVLLPGDREFAFASSVVEKVSLEIAPLDGTSPPRHLLEVDGSYGAVQSVSGDGRYLAFSVYRPGQWSDLWYVDLAAAKPEPTSFLATPATEYTPRLSPDGRFVAYVSNESGEDAIYLRSFPDGGDRRRVSTAGGFDPAWRRDGRELFYAAGNLSLITMMSIPVEAGPGLRLGAPRKLFETAMQVGGDSARNFAVSADGSRFLVVRHEDSGISLSSSTDVRFEIRVVPGWAASLDGEGSGSRTP